MIGHRQGSARSVPAGCRRRTAVWSVVAAGMWLAGTGFPTAGQEPKTLPPGDRTGKVLGPAPGGMQVQLLNSGEKLIVAPARDATVEVGGTASREMLAPKQFVQVSLDLDDFGKVSQPVDKVTFPGGGTPGVSVAGLGGAEPKGKRPTGKRPAGNYLVSGFIKTADEDGFVVQVGRERFEIPLAADAELEVRTANLALAGVGDEVELEGQYVQQGQLLASKIKVTLANPLAPPQKGKRRAAPAAP